MPTPPPHDGAPDAGPAPEDAAADQSAAEPNEDPAALLHARLTAARNGIESQVARTVADFDKANERIKQRTGRDLIVAILIGLGIGAVLLLSLLIWKPAFVVMAAAAVVLGVIELRRALMDAGRHVDLVPQLIGVAVLLASAWFLPVWQHWTLVCAAVALVILWRLVAQAIRRDGRTAASVRDDLVAGSLLQLYVPFTASLCVLLLRQAHGQWWVLAFIIVAVAADTGAYATGLTLGRHPMAPRISPKKTWEGFGGAVAAAVIAGLALAAFMLHVPLWAGIVFGLVILATATIGDLGESMIKRDMGIKDMSSWLPGHGGVLDRLDSILPSAGAALALFVLLTPLATS